MDSGNSAAFSHARAGPRAEGGGGHDEGSTGTDYNALNDAFSSYLFIICGAVSVAVILWKVFDIANKYTRKLACLGNDKQRFFAIPSPSLASLKQHILYAPIFSKRHNREIQLSSAINVGTLPTRFQLLFLIGYFATNVVFCVMDVPFAATKKEAAAQLRNRSGVLATVNMVPLFVLAGRNNPLIPLLGISFDTYNLLHRWFGRIVVLEAICHTLAHLAKNGWEDAIPHAWNVPFMRWGLIAVAAFVVIGIQANSPVRHAFYEFFKLLHIALAALALVGLWYHLVPKAFPGFQYVYATIGLWAMDRMARVLRVCYANLGRSRSKTIVEAMPGNACRITMTMARPWASRPGQHAYLYMPGISLWQSHPFTVAWNENEENFMSEKPGGAAPHDIEAAKSSQVCFLVRARTGFTNNLYQKAAAAPGGRMEVAAYAEGPYGVTHALDSYGSVVLFAGGVGITHQVPYIKHLVTGFSEGTVATRRLLLVWTVQSPEHLEWIRPWMTEILGLDRRRDVLRIMLFVSQPRSSKEIHSPSSTVQMFPGRPNIQTLLGMEQEQQVGAMAVTVCGPGALSDEVRRAVRMRQSRSSMDFIEEAFSW